MEKETKSYSERMEENIEEVSYYFEVAMDVIGKKFGTTYTKEHPELIASFVQAAAIKDLESTIINATSKEVK